MPQYTADQVSLLLRLLDMMSSGLLKPLFLQGKPLAGDTVTNASSLKAFASQAVIPGIATKPSDLILVLCAGDYENPTGAVNPTAEPQIYLNTSQAGTAGAQSAGVGTGVSHPFISLSLINVIDLQTCHVFGFFAFEGVNSVTALKLFSQRNLAIDFTKDVTVSARVQTNAAGDGATFRMGSLSVTNLTKG